MSSAPTHHPDWRSAGFQVARLRGVLTTNDPKFHREFQEVFFKRPQEQDPIQLNYSVYVDRDFGLMKRHSVSRNGQFFLVTAFYPALLPALERDISITLFDNFPTYRFLRAGLVAFGGVGILILGNNETGGGWLVKALADRGGMYFSDGITILDYPEACVIPYPKSISLLRPTNPMLPRTARTRNFRDPSALLTRYYTPSRIAERKFKQAIRCILVPAPEKSAVPRLDPLPKAQALHRLMESTFNTRKWDSEILSYLANIVDSAECYSLVRGMSKATVDLIVARSTELKS